MLRAWSSHASIVDCRARMGGRGLPRIECMQFWFGRLWVLLCSIRVSVAGWLVHNCSEPCGRLFIIVQICLIVIEIKNNPQGSTQPLAGGRSPPAGHCSIASQLPSQFQKSRCHGRGLCVHRSFTMVALFRASASRARLPGVEAQMPHRASSAGFARRHTNLARDAHHSREGCTLRNITRISCL